MKKLAILAAFFFIATSFYWVQIRPAQIKHDCSWVRVYEEAKPGRPAKTEAELKEAGLIKNCSSQQAGYQSIFNTQQTWADKINATAKDLCQQENQKIIGEYKLSKDPIPAKEWWRPSRKEEYQFCLHDKGL